MENVDRKHMKSYLQLQSGHRMKTYLYNTHIALKMWTLDLQMWTPNIYIEIFMSL